MQSFQLQPNVPQPQIEQFTMKLEADVYTNQPIQESKLSSSDLAFSSEQISKSTTIEEEDLNQQFSDMDDYTDQSYSYPYYSDESALSNDQALMVSKYRDQVSFEFSSDGNGGNSQYIFQTIPRNLSQFFESQLYGDVIVESGYSNQDEKSLNSFCNWKLLSQAIKYSNYVKLFSSDIQPSSENFLAAIQICMQQNSRDLYEIAQLLTQFSRIFSFIKAGFSKMAQYIQIFSKHDALQKRHQLFEEKTDNYLAQLPKDALFFAVKVEPNFQSLQLETRSLCFSNAFFQLVNMDVSQFITISLKGKTPEFFGWQARLMFLRHKLYSYLRQEIPYQDYFVDILTRDGMRVPSKARREKFNFNLDKELPELELGQLSEFMVIYYFDIDPVMKQQISFMRENHKIDGFDNQDQSEFNTYSLETQAFLDMYYSHYSPSLKLQQKRLLSNNISH